MEWWRETVPDVAVHEAYGQTEAGVFVGDCEALGVAHKPGRMGRVMPGYELGILDIDTGEPVTDGERGELALRYEGALGCFGGFWNAPGKTDDRIQNGWLLTGDVGSIGADGYVSFYSRTDDVITSASYRIGPAEIEESLAEHEAVTNAGVIGVPDDTRGEILKAFVMLAPEVTPSDDRAATLQDHVKSRVAKHEYPRELEFVDELPLTTTGKVRRHDLRNQEGLVD